MSSRKVTSNSCHQQIKKEEEENKKNSDDEKIFVYRVGGREFPNFSDACEESETNWNYADIIKTLAPSPMNPALTKSLKLVGGILVFQRYEYSKLYKAWLDKIDETI